MFLGQHQYPFDSNNHLTVPPDFPGLLGKGAYITQGFDRNLLVLTADFFRHFMSGLRR